MRTSEEEVALRTEQRKRYFENPEYLKWSDCVRINHEEYGELSDVYLFHRYVIGRGFKALTVDDVEQAMNPKMNSTIDFEAVYAYFNKRLNDENNVLKQEITFLSLYTEKSLANTSVKYILDKYRETVLESRYDMI